MFDLANLADNGGFDAGEENAPACALFRPRARRGDAARLRGDESRLRLARGALGDGLANSISRAPGADYAAYARDCLAKFETARAAYRNRYGSLK